MTVLPVPDLKPKDPLDKWVSVPGADYKAVHVGKLPSKQFKRILEAGNEMYTYIAQSRPDLAAEWLAVIQPPDRYQHK